MVCGHHAGSPSWTYHPLSALVVVLAIPVVLVASNAVAVLPARSVARAKSAEALRSE